MPWKGREGLGKGEGRRTCMLLQARRALLSMYLNTSRISPPSSFLCRESRALLFSLRESLSPQAQAPLPLILTFPFLPPRLSSPYQVAEGSYDFEANKTLLKLYLLYPPLANQEKVETVR